MPAPKSQRARAQPANRPRRNLQHPRSTLVHAKLRMHRPVVNPQCLEPHSSRILQSPFALRLAIAMASRKSSPRNTALRADRACRKSRARAAARRSIKPFHRHFAPRNIRLDQQSVASRAREAPESPETPSAAQSAAQPPQIPPHCSPVSLLGSRKARSVSRRKEISPAQAHRPRSF